MTEVEYDYVVIGAGAAGCVMANRLSQDPQRRVALVEAGGLDRSPVVRIPRLSPAAARSRRHRWTFLTEPVAGLGGRRVEVLQGQILGGSTSINGLVYTRGCPDDYDQWQALGCEGWGAAAVAPFFDLAERMVLGSDGTTRPSSASCRSSHPFSHAFLDAARAAGHPSFERLGQRRVDGFGHYDVAVQGGVRSSAARAYLWSARGRPNLTVMTGVVAERILFDRAGACAVEVCRKGHLTCLRARREVVVAAGAIKTPQLLMVSGVGAAEHLQELGIAVLVDSPGVGQNLQNHPCLRMKYRFGPALTAGRGKRALQAAQEVVRYAWERKGLLAQPPAMVGGFFRSDPTLPRPDAQLVLAESFDTRGGGWSSAVTSLSRSEGCTITVYQGTPRSTGSVTLRSPDPHVAPSIRPGYFSDEGDLERLRQAVEVVRDVMRRPEAAAYLAEETVPGESVKNGADLAAALPALVDNSYHQSGTCRMGCQPDAVVDPRLKVRGVDHLRVVDTSVIPVLPNAALYAPALMIAEKAASLVMQEP